MRWNRLWGAFGSCYELDQNNAHTQKMNPPKNEWTLGWLNWRTQHRFSIEQRIITPHYRNRHTHTHGSDESTKAEKNNYCVSFLAFKKDYYMLWMKYNLNTVQKMIESRTKKRRWRAKWTNVEWARTKKSIFFPFTKPFHRSKECVTVSTYMHARIYTLLLLHNVRELVCQDTPA